MLKTYSMHIERVMRRAPEQLAKSQDGSSTKFGFKGVVPGVQGYARLAGAIDWLKTAGLVYKLPIVNKACMPLSAYAENFVLQEMATARKGKVFSWPLAFRL